MEDDIKRLERITKKVNGILVSELPKLSYFNNINFTENAKTLNRVLGSVGVLANNQFALYVAGSNMVVIDEKIFDYNIPDEIMEILLLHEYIHMASTDFKTKIIGYESDALPVTYNEALTQWLTLKLYYGDKGMGTAIRNNLFYPESVKIIDEIIKRIGEEKVFNGFFEADVKKNMHSYANDDMSVLIDYILMLSNTEEEHLSKNGINAFNNKISETKKNI